MVHSSKSGQEIIVAARAHAERSIRWATSYTVPSAIGGWTAQLRCDLSFASWIKLVLEVGMGSDCGCFFGGHMQNSINAGVKTKADYDAALTNMFRVHMRLGHFDPAESQPYMLLQYGADRINILEQVREPATPVRFRFLAALTAGLAICIVNFLICHCAFSESLPMSLFLDTLKEMASVDYVQGYSMDSSDTSGLAGLLPEDSTRAEHHIVPVAPASVVRRSRGSNLANVIEEAPMKHSQIGGARCIQVIVMRLARTVVAADETFAAAARTTKLANWCSIGCLAILGIA